MSAHVAIYTRVSKQSQDYQRQVAELTALAQQNGFVIETLINEKASGASPHLERSGLQALMQLARSGAIQKVLVSEVSRLGRKTSEVLKVIEDLTALGVSVYVLQYGLETLLPDGKRNPMAQLLFTLLAEFARLERETLIDRIQSGLDEARRKGVSLGRRKGSVKPTTVFLQENKQVQQCLKKGYSIRHTAAICGVSPGTVQKVKRLLEGVKAEK